MDRFKILKLYENILIIKDNVYNTTYLIVNFKKYILTEELIEGEVISTIYLISKYKITLNPSANIKNNYNKLSLKSKKIIDISFLYHTDFISNLNIELGIKCKHMHIEFDYLYNMTISSNIKDSLLFYYDKPCLALYYKDICASIIKCNIKKLNINKDDYCLELNSKSFFEGKKYNKLLRAILINVANNFLYNYTNINYIFSNCINPISILLLIKYYDYILYDIDSDSVSSRSYDKDISIDELPKEEYIIIPLNDSNISKSNLYIRKLLSIDIDSIICL